MRLHIGPVPLDEGFHPEEGGWRRLKEPAFGHQLLLSVPLSVLLAAGMFAAWWALARLHGVAGSGDVVVTPAGLLTAVAALVALIVGYELLHAATLPGFGLTPATTVGFWPRTVTPYVAHMGELSRNRFATVASCPSCCSPCSRCSRAGFSGGCLRGLWRLAPSTLLSPPAT